MMKEKERQKREKEKEEKRAAKEAKEKARADAKRKGQGVKRKPFNFEQVCPHHLYRTQFVTCSWLNMFVGEAADPHGYRERISGLQ